VSHYSDLFLEVGQLSSNVHEVMIGQSFMLFMNTPMNRFRMIIPSTTMKEMK